MSAAAITLVLAAAFSHAGWNLIIKRLADHDEIAFLWITGVCSTVIYGSPAVAVFAAARPHIGWAQIGFIGGSALLHLGYFVLLQRGYRAGDLSLVYPLARGTGPMLASVAAIAFFGERPGLLGLAGIALVGLGVLAIGLSDHSGPDGRLLTAVWFGLATGVFIATYTVWDKHAVTALAIPPLIYNWAEETARALCLTPFALRRRRRNAVHTLWTAHRRRILGCAAMMPLSYILVLTALQFSPVSAIAPAREVSVLIGVALAGRLLAEGHLPRRLLAATAIAGGVIAIALG